MNSKEAKTYPNLLCIGAQKSGTTWIHKCLSHHPDIYMSTPKELDFFQFSRNLNAENLEKYLGNFEAGKNYKVRGESTPTYFWTYSENSKYQPVFSNKNIPKTIKDFIGEDLKFIVTLRNPVDRAISAYFHNFMMGRFKGNEELIDCLDKYGIAELGFYQRHLNNWYTQFSAEKFIVIVYDQIKDAPDKVMESVLKFLGLKQHKLPIKKIQNPGFKLKNIDDFLTIDLSSREKINNKFLSGGLKKMNKNYTIPKIKQGEIEILFEMYKKDIMYVNSLFPQETEGWLNPYNLFAS
ncbi:MAG: sulfotransferase [Cyclobacteriaceae bacterium]